jgi:hypothetical protein
MASRRAHVILPDDLLSQIDALVGARGRSQFLTDLARREVHRLRLLQFLDDKPRGWSAQKHPELRKGGKAWVESLRQEDQQVDDRKDERRRVK